MGKKTTPLNHDLVRELMQNPYIRQGINAEIKRETALQARQHIIEYDRLMGQNYDKLMRVLQHATGLAASLRTVAYIAKVMKITTDRKALLAGIEEEFKLISYHWNKFFVLTKNMEYLSQTAIHYSQQVGDILSDLEHMQSGDSTGELIRQYIDTGEFDKFQTSFNQIVDRFNRNNKRVPKILDPNTEYIGANVYRLKNQPNPLSYWDILEYLIEGLENKPLLGETEQDVLDTLKFYHDYKTIREWRNYAKKAMTSWENRTNRGGIHERGLCGHP